MEKCIVENNRIVEFANNEIRAEKDMADLFDRITSEIIDNQGRYEKNAYVMLLMKTEKGTLSDETISIGTTNIDSDYSKIDLNPDDSPVDGAYYTGRSIADQFYRMGFPVRCLTADGLKSMEDYTGPLGIILITPGEFGMRVLFRSLDGFGSFSEFVLAYDIILSETGNAYSFDISDVYSLPQYITEFADAISDFCYSERNCAGAGK